MENIVLFESLDLTKASNEDFYTTTEIIAEKSEVSYKAVSNLVRTHKAKLEKIAPLTWHFEKSASNNGRATRKIYHLNEQQTLFFIPLLGNTPAVVQFKFDLASAFVAMRNELQRRQIGRATEKPLKRELNRVIAQWDKAPKMAYTTMNRLLIKLATGEPIKAVKARDGTQDIMLNLLTATEQEIYSDLENVAIGLIMAQLEYSFIKDTLEKIATKKAVISPDKQL